MKTLLRIAAIAAAFGLAPAAAQTAPAPAPAAPVAAPAEAPAPDADANSAAPATGNEAAAAPATVNYQSPVRPEAGIGQPDGRAGLQDQVTPIGEEAAWFHNAILMPAITLISLLVLFLLLWVIVRYRRAAHPNPSRTSHNTTIEVIWTLVPVLILVVIAIPSIRLLAHQYSPPAADLTIKVTGNQWNWGYQYPDHGIEFVSNMLSDADAAARGEPRLLGVDERIVVPVGATVKLIVTASDVIHSFAVPAFWVKIDAVPGRLNETWFRAERPGIYYGQCSELCGARHAYMPIAVEVVSQADFERWVASRDGTMPGSAPEAAANASAPAAATVGAESNTAATPAPSNTVDAVTNQPVILEQGTSNRENRE